MKYEANGKLGLQLAVTYLREKLKIYRELRTATPILMVEIAAAASAVPAAAANVVEATAAVTEAAPSAVPYLRRQVWWQRRRKCMPMQWWLRK